MNKYEKSTYKEWKKQKRRWKTPCLFCKSNETDYKKRYFLIPVGNYRDYSVINYFYVFCNENCANLWILRDTM